MNSSIIILFLASIALSVPVGEEGLLTGITDIGKEIVAAAHPHRIPKPLPIANPGTMGASVASSSSREKVQLTPEAKGRSLQLKSLLDQRDAEQARIRKATLSYAEEKALTQKLNDLSNFAGKNGDADFADDFIKLMAHIETQPWH